MDALWNLMGEMKVEPDEELTALVRMHNVFYSQLLQ